jgi:hypothetical protein
MMIFVTVLAVLTLPGCTNSEQPTNTGDTTAVNPDPNGARINPPPSEMGFQVAVGPFDVPAGTETQRNYFMKLPNDKEIYVTKFQIRFNKGSYHMNMFKSDVVSVADHFEESFDPINYADWEMLVATQDSVFTWTFPPGTYYRLKPHQQMLIQTNYANTAEQPTPSGHGKILINFWTTDTPDVTSSLGSLMAGYDNLTVPPRTSVTYCKLLPAIPVDVNALVSMGHFHRRGTSFVMGHWDGQKLRDTLYRNQTWYDPPVDIFACGFGITPQDTLAFVTTFENPTDTEITYGPRADQEYAYYYMSFMPAPPDGKTIYDFSPGFMIESHPL